MTFGQISLMVASAVLVSQTAMAAITVSATGTPGVDVFQQQTNSPCVIGDPSCRQPAGFGFDVQSGTPGGGNGSTYDLFSPVYQAGAAVSSGNIIPTTFSVGVDDNFAPGQGNEILRYFTTWTCGPGSTAGPTTIISNQTSLPSNCLSPAINTANSFGTPTSPVNFTIPDISAGTGFSDMVLQGFSLTTGNFYVFEASVSNDSGGMEQFFIVPGGSTSPVPEPASVFLLGTALIFAGKLLHRRVSS